MRYLPSTPKRTEVATSFDQKPIPAQSHLLSFSATSDGIGVDRYLQPAPLQSPELDPPADRVALPIQDLVPLR